MKGTSVEGDREMAFSALPTVRHWQYRKDEQGVLWLSLDKQGSHVNTIDTLVLNELGEILTCVSTHAEAWRGLAIRSAKPSGFAVGADIQQLRNVSTFEEAYALIDQGQVVFKQLAKLPIPTIAILHGYCLGGGLELALACHYRIALNDSKARLGLPEVMLGVHPGWGGTIRLPRLIGGLKAMELILSGRSFDAKQAFKLGVVDASIPEWDVDRAVSYYLLTRPPLHSPSGLEAASNWDVARPILARIMRRKLAQKVNRQHYPAPYAALENWLQYGVMNDEAFENEARSIAQLMITDTTKNLVRVFNLQERLKSQYRDANHKPTHVHIVGAGIMGGDIGAYCALKGISTTIEDEKHSALASALGRAMALFKRQQREPHLIQAARDRLTPDEQGKGVRTADLIVEAIIEKLDAKVALFNRLSSETKPNALLATNTSTIPIEEIAQNVSDPSRVVGIHFFNPVAKMPLVEIACPEAVDEDYANEAIAFVRALDKLPLRVKSTPGFLVNRVLMPYLIESLQLVEEGVPPAALDHAIEEFGMPMGPIELMDNVGIDVCLYALESLSRLLPSLEFTIDSALGRRVQTMVKEGRLGKKSGRGFYHYRNGKAQKPSLKADYRIPEDAVDRVILRLINEAIAALRERIVEDADLLDAGLIFGAGFAPFRGGPIHYVLEQGEGLMLKRLNLLVQRYGRRFEPDPGWGMLDAT